MYRFIYIILFFFVSCSAKPVKEQITAAKILGNPNYQAICYGGYRTNTRDIEPTVEQIKEDMRILAAMKIKVVRTYNVHFKEIANLLTAITELKKEQDSVCEPNVAGQRAQRLRC